MIYMIHVINMVSDAQHKYVNSSTKAEPWGLMGAHGGSHAYGTCTGVSTGHFKTVMMLVPSLAVERHATLLAQSRLKPGPAIKSRGAAGQVRGPTCLIVLLGL